MKFISLAVLSFLLLAGTCFARSSPALCPRHIDAPDYPAVARVLHVEGKVVLRVTIGADGAVLDAKPASGSKADAILDDAATENVRHWTFAKPPSAPYVETITYVYEIDQSLPSDDGTVQSPAITRLSFDLPDRVTVRTNAQISDP